MTEKEKELLEETFIEDQPLDDEDKELLRIEGGKAFMQEADCPNHDCVEKGAVTKTGQIILCLPHKLAVTIVNEGEEAPDAISY